MYIYLPRVLPRVHNACVILFCFIIFDFECNVWIQVNQFFVTLIKVGRCCSDLFVFCRSKIKILFDWFAKLATAKIWMWLLPSVFKISVRKLLCLNGSVGVLVYCIRFWSCEGLSYENNEKLNIVFFNVVTKRITYKSSKTKVFFHFFVTWLKVVFSDSFETVMMATFSFPSLVSHI